MNKTHNANYKDQEDDINLEERVTSLENRVSSLENNQGNNSISAAADKSNKKKKPTMAELTKSREFNNGQEKVTFVTGYYEKITNRDAVGIEDIREGWQKAGFKGKFRTNYLDRAVKDGLLRELDENLFDLSLSGEEFFDRADEQL